MWALLLRCETALKEQDVPRKGLQAVRDRLVKAMVLSKLRDAGLTWAEISDKIGKPASTLQQAMPMAVRLAEHELNAPSIEERDRQIVDYVVRQCHSYEEAGEKFGLSLGRIGYIVRAAKHPSARGPGRPKNTIDRHIAHHGRRHPQRPSDTRSNPQ